MDEAKARAEMDLTRTGLDWTHKYPAIAAASQRATEATTERSGFSQHVSSG